MKVQMQQSTLTSSFLLPWSVWLQLCQSQAFIIVFKIKMSSLGDGHGGETEGESITGQPCSQSAKQKPNREIGEHMFMSINNFFCVINSQNYIFSSLIFHLHTCKHTLIDNVPPLLVLTRCKQIAWNNPPWKPHPSLTFLNSLTGKHTPWIVCFQQRAPQWK